MLRRQEKCREVVVGTMAVRNGCPRRSELVFFAVPQQTRSLFFRACVTLRRILAARKRPVARRIRKAVLLAGIWFVGGRQLVGEETSFSAADEIRPIHELGASIAPPAGELPPNDAPIRFARLPVIDAASMGGRGWLEYSYFWHAPGLCHRPLYFEEPNLERYGHHAGCVLQPLVSGAHFFSAVGTLPLRMALRPPHRCRYSLGHGRPGSHAAW
jgi:hypothetical protein